ncbi:MAG TPA: CsbD family protein [Ktedonobacteraceae bacterium]
MSTHPIWNQVQGNWKQFTGQVKTQWGKLTDDDLMQINGNREQLAGKIQQRYGITQAEANRQVDEWAN